LRFAFEEHAPILGGVPFLLVSMKTFCRKSAPLLAAALLSGCATPSHEADQAGSQVKETGTQGKQVVASRKAFEDRVKALTSFAAGLSSEIRKDEDEALDKYFNSIKADPSNQRLALDLARRLLRKQEVKKAIEVLEEVRRTNKSSGTIDALLGVAYHQDKQANMAIEASEAAILKSPDFILGYRTLFQIHSSLRNEPAALETLKRAAKQDDVPTIFVLEVAELLSAHLRANPDRLASEKALLLDLIGRCEEREAKLPIVRERLAEMYEVAGEIEKSAELLKGLAAESPRGNHRQKLLSLYLRTSNREAATAEVDLLLREQPTNAGFYHLRGALAADSDDAEGAIANYRKALQFDERNPRFYTDLAVALLNVGKHDESLELLEKYRKQFKSDFVTEFYTALAFGRKKDYEKAIRHYTEAEVLAKAGEPERLTPFFYFQVGAAQERNQDFKGAEQTFRKVLAMKPDFADALNYLGYMWAERGEKLDEAYEMITKAVAAEPDNAAFLDSMGWVLYMRGSYHEAIPWLVRSVELTDPKDETDPTLYEHLADAYFKTKDFRNARKEYERALRIQDKPEIRKKLQEAIEQGKK
jgi:tetratricopeptide (TPR) repeat protein